MVEEGGRVMDFILHPQFIGRACRVNALGELISYMKSRGSWITTNDEIARYVLQQEWFSASETLKIPSSCGKSTAATSLFFFAKQPHKCELNLPYTI